MAENYSRVEKDRYGGNRYLDGNGYLHRTDGPAWEKHYGGWEWHYHGMFHRIGGPAAYFPDHEEHNHHPIYEWWHENVVHRLDGPALIYADGRSIWVIDGLYFDANRDPRLGPELIKWATQHRIKFPLDEEQLIQFRLTWADEIDEIAWGRKIMRRLRERRAF